MFGDDMALKGVIACRLQCPELFVFPVGLPDFIGTTTNMPIGYKLLKNTTHMMTR